MSSPAEDDAPISRSLIEELLFALKVSRPGFYITTVWFFVLPLAQRDMFTSWVFWLGVFYVCFPLGYMMYGWNDIMDVETDKLNPRKDSYLFGARVGASDVKKVAVTMVVLQLPFMGLFVWIAGWKMLAWFAVAFAVNGLYNAPKWGFKNHPVVDILNQAGYLLVFVLSAWLNDVPHLSWDVMVFSALFAMHSHLFGQLMDLEADKEAGRRTTASVIGVVPGKLLLVAMLAAECAIVWTRDPIVAGFLGVCATVFLVDVSFLFRGKAYPQWAIKTFFLAWNVVAIVSVNWLWTRGTLIN